MTRFAAADHPATVAVEGHDVALLRDLPHGHEGLLESTPLASELEVLAPAVVSLESCVANTLEKLSCRGTIPRRLKSWIIVPIFLDTSGFQCCPTIFVL